MQYGALYIPPDWRLASPTAKARLAAVLRAATVQYTDWHAHGAREAQRPPDGDWAWWLMLAGRGFGKTRSGAEWAWRQAYEMPGSRGALIAPTAADARDVLVEGESGVLACVHPLFRPVYEPSKRRLSFPNKSMMFTYSADEPERLRGPQHHWAWVDEWAAMPRGAYLKDMVELGLRLGDHPRGIITTTPRPWPWLVAATKDADTVVTGGSTFDNIDNLPQRFIDRVVRRYEGTRLGQQELFAQLLLDVEGALFRAADVEATRWTEPVESMRVVVGVDPAVSTGEGSAETGIVAVGLVEHPQPQFQVLADRSGRYSPDGWARVVLDLVHEVSADAVIAERNQGGDLVRANLRTVEPYARVRLVTASRGKRTRAEPVAALYEQHRVHHVGVHPELEDQMFAWVPGVGESPDRVDALVWAVTALNGRTGDPARGVRT